MTKDTKKKNQLVKAKTTSLQKRASNIVSRGLSDLALLDVEEAKITDKEMLLQANELLEKGNRYYSNGDYDKAIDAYTSAITLNPNLAGAYDNRGSAYFIKGQYDRAIEDYNKAIALDPNYAKAYYNRGVAYADKGQYGRAIEDYNKAIDIKPNDVAAYNNRGLVYERLGNKNKAIFDYRKACDMGDELGCENLQRVLREK